MKLHGTDSLFNWLGIYSKVSPVWVVCALLLIVGPQLLLTHQRVGLTLMLTGCDYKQMSCCMGLNSWSKSHFSGALVPVEATLKMSVVVVGGALVQFESCHRVC